MAGAACVATPPVRSSEPPTAGLQLSPVVVSPGIWIRVHGAGFRVGEYVDIVVIDPPGNHMNIGRLIADARGDIDVEVAPHEQASNGMSVIRLDGTESERTAAVSIQLTGASDAGPTASEQPGWSVKSDAQTSCAQCLLVHGQAP
jgi:hypothetical protein